jgi:PKD repeat protein
MLSRILFLFLIAFLVTSFHPTLSEAHLQPGPPYLLINGQYADTTLVNASSGKIVSPQDITNENFLVSTPISFEVDLSRLQVPATVVQQSRWRWKWDLRDSTYEEGSKKTHTYTKIGSYIVTLQVKDPTTPDFFDYDLVQINVVPNLGYKIPTAEISTSLTSRGSVRDVVFTAKAAADPTTEISSYIWDFNDGAIGDGQSTLHSYDNIDVAVFPLVRVTDKNGLFSDTEIRLYSYGTTGFFGSTVPTSSAKSSTVAAEVIPSWIEWVIGGILLVALGAILLRRILNQK